MKIQTFNCSQINQSFDIAVIKIKDLVNNLNLKVDYHNPDTNPNGYQRDFTKSKVKGIMNYLKGSDNPVIPIPLLLNIREEDFNVSVNSTQRLLDIKKETPIYIIDGNHRYQAYRKLFEESPEKFGEIGVPITLLNTDTTSETVNFLVVNKTATPVRTDLAERNLQSISKSGKLSEKSISDLPVEKWKVYAVEIIDTLTTSPDSVLYKQINRPGEEKVGTLNQVSVTDSLKFLYKEQLHINYGLNPEKVAKSLMNMWKALKQTMPKSFDEPKEYLLLKTMGVNVVHRIYRALVPLLSRENNFTYELFLKLFTHQDSEQFFNDEYWSKENFEGVKKWGIGQASFKTAFEDIWMNGINLAAEEILDADPNLTIKL